MATTPMGNISRGLGNSVKFYWPDHILDIKFGANPTMKLLKEPKHPRKCLILEQEANEYLDSKGMGEYVAYKNLLRSLLTPKGVIEVVKEYSKEIQ